MAPDLAWPGGAFFETSVRREADSVDDAARARDTLGARERDDTAAAAQAELASVPVPAAPAAPTRVESAASRLAALRARLDATELGRATPTEAAATARSWAEALRESGVEPLAAIDEVLPSCAWFQARLITPRDEDDLYENARATGAYGAAYKLIRDSLPLARSAAASVKSMLDAVWDSSPAAKALAEGPVAVLKRGDRWIPGKDALAASHRYALDVFFTSIKRHGAEETGPAVRSMTRGIVVSAEDGWRGGDKNSSYKSGGLSPKAGNGAIVYCPDDGRYYAYFHLRSLSVRPGQLVAAGDTLGLGGNTGINARKKGHGGHVHVEIHAPDGSALSSYSIRDYILSIH